MGGTNGKATDPVIAELEQSPYGFDFFRAVRLIEAWRSELPRVGFSRSPSEDPVRFYQNPSLAFAPSTLEAFRRNGTQSAPKLLVHFFGLFGPNSPLPSHLTEYAHERQLNYGDRTITAFFNVFHHRLLTFFYRAWAANQKAVDLDRPESQRYASFVGSFFGIGMEALQQRDAVPDWAKLFFSGRLAYQTRNAEGLEAILGAFFQIKTKVETFVGRWINLPPDCVCKLGDSPESGSLGLTTIVGSRFWECQLSFRIRLGPMKLADYERMLPSGDSFQRLKSWVLNYCGEHFFWDVQMVLKADEVPQICLGSAGRVGWTTWLKTQPFDHDAADLILNPPDT
jgi:type VI secretion system protein ImpH